MRKKFIKQRSQGGSIDDLIEWLEGGKSEGANNFDIIYIEDRGISYSSLQLYKSLTEQEIKKARIEALEKELKELKK